MSVLEAERAISLLSALVQGGRAASIRGAGLPECVAGGEGLGPCSVPSH